MGIVARRKPRGPRRKEGDAGQRVEYAKKHIGDNASRILFSDEKCCDINDHGGAIYAWVRRGELAGHREVDRYSPKIMCWGMIGVGVKVLCWLDKQSGVGAKQYTERCLLPNLSVLRTRILMQDGAKAHSAKSTAAFLMRNGVSTLSDHPPRSPDLNVIEVLWARIQAIVDRRGPIDEVELKRFWQEEWDKFSQAEINRLVLSFNARQHACIKLKGLTLPSTWRKHIPNRIRAGKSKKLRLRRATP